MVKIILLGFRTILRVDTERVMEHGMNSDEVIIENAQNNNIPFLFFLKTIPM